MAPRPKRRVMVEGKNDKFAVINLMLHHGVSFGTAPDNDPEVWDTVGVANLLQEIGPALKTYDRLAIVVDADDDPASRWEAVRGALSGVTVPAAPPLEGFVGAGARPATRVGVWMMPDNAGRGMLETFLATLVPDTDASWPETVGVVTRAKQLGAPFKSADKARIHTWLAWQDPEGLPFGTAIASHALRHDSEAGNSFAAWFRRVLIDD